MEKSRDADRRVLRGPKIKTNTTVPFVGGTIKYRSAKQKSFDFLEEHPLIRNLSEYGNVVRVDFQKETRSETETENETDTTKDTRKEIIY